MSGAVQAGLLLVLLAALLWLSTARGACVAGITHAPLLCANPGVFAEYGLGTRR